MKLELKIIKNGTSKAVIIPAFVLKQMGKTNGDTIKIEIKEEN